MVWFTHVLCNSLCMKSRSATRGTAAKNKSAVWLEETELEVQRMLSNAGLKMECPLPAPHD